MVVGQSPGVHERPTKTGLGHAAVIADKTTCILLPVRCTVYVSVSVYVCMCTFTLFVIIYHNIIYYDIQ